MRRPRERTGVLILRVWLEDSNGSLRARITEASDLDVGEPSTHVAANTNEIVAIVGAWVEQFVSASR
jgi:hypothetical protein